MVHGVPPLDAGNSAWGTPLHPTARVPRGGQPSEQPPDVRPTEAVAGDEDAAERGGLLSEDVDE